MEALLPVLLNVSYIWNLLVSPWKNALGAKEHSGQEGKQCHNSQVIGRAGWSALQRAKPLLPYEMSQLGAIF
jgi:hypothetical protein